MKCLLLAAILGMSAQAQFFSTGNPDGKMAVATRPGLSGKIEIEAGDDFVLSTPTSIAHASFTGLLTNGTSVANVGEVVVEIYRVFPLDSVDPPSGNVPTRGNSPSDNAFTSRSQSAGDFFKVVGLLSSSFTAANSVLNGINPSPYQTTGGEGPVTGKEVRFDLTFTNPISLPAGHYFFVPQVQVNGGEFMWLSAPKPIVSPGTPFSPDLQAWIRNANLDPDWLRVGTDIVGGDTPPTFNMTFTLDDVPGTDADFTDLFFTWFFLAP
jgi:hypothetical protein